MKKYSKSKLVFFSGVPIDDAALVYRAGLLAKVLKARGLEVIFTSVSANFRSVSEQTVWGIKVRFIGQAHYQAKRNFSKRKRLGLLTVIRECLITGWRFWEILETEKPEAVLVFTTMPSSLMIGLVAGLKRVRVLIDIDDLTIGQMEAIDYSPILIRLYDGLERCFIKLFFRQISVCSHNLQERYRGSVLIPNMIDLDWWRTSENRPLAEKVRQIIFIGHVNTYQGQKEILEALTPVLRRHSEVMMAFVGGGNELARLKSLAGEKQLSSQVIFTGQVSPERVKALLSQSQIGILPLWNKPVHLARHPLKLLNYMAMGLVVVANKVGEAEKLIKNQKNGLLCPAGDLNCLAEQVEKVIDQPQLIPAIGRQAIKSVRPYSISRVFPKWIDFLKQ